MFLLFFIYTYINIKEHEVYWLFLNKIFFARERSHLTILYSLPPAHLSIPLYCVLYAVNVFYARRDLFMKGCRRATRNAYTLFRIQ